MVKTKNNLFSRLKIVILAAMLLSMAVFIFKFAPEVRAFQSAECDVLSGEAEAKCEELERKAQAYQDLIDIKNKQQATLQKQMELLDLEQAKNRQDLTVIRSKAGALDNQIQEFETQIEIKETLLKYQKSLLEGLMQSYYEDYQDGVLNIVLINKNFSDILNQSDYVTQASARVKDILVTIETAKTELETEQNKLSATRLANEQVKSQLENKNYDLQSSETQKQSLMSKTQGEEQKYQDLLARVEEQKAELFNFSASGNAGDVLATVNSYAKPDSKYWASVSWYFSQRDPRWANKTIGNSGSSMEDYGCAVSSLSMVFKYYGASVDPGRMAKQKIFYYDLIQWPGSWSPNIQLASSVAHSGVSWSTVDKAIKNKQPVIVYIKKTNGRGGHYVVIHNKDSKDYIVHDPYFGANLYLGTSRALMGAMNPKSGTVVDQAIIYN